MSQHSAAVHPLPGQGWKITPHTPGIPPVVASRLTRAEDTTREIIALHTGTPRENITLNLTPHLPEPQAQLLEELITAETQAKHAAQRAERALRELAPLLRNDGLFSTEMQALTGGLIHWQRFTRALRKTPPSPTEQTPHTP